MISISDARITFVAAECFTAHLDPDRSGRSRTYFNGVWAYDVMYNRLRGDPDQGSVALPWRDGQKSAFWRHYLGDFPGNVRARTAWDAFVPLRLLDGPGPVETDQNERVVVDVFGYQFGIAAAITIHVAKRADMAIDTWIERLRRLRLARPFALGNSGLSLEDVFAVILDHYRQSYFCVATPGTRSAEPFSVNTVIQADGGLANIPLDEVLQRRLHAVTAWPQDWENALLPPLGSPEHQLPMRSRNQVAGDVLYAAPRGRTAWRPGLFARRRSEDGPQRRHTLSCLAHNLVAGAVQTEMLRLLAARASAVPKAELFVDIATLRAAGRKLDQLRQGNGTFRSHSIRAHIEERSGRFEVNQLLDLVGAPLIPPP